jgi:hypothetical protein
MKNRDTGKNQRPQSVPVRFIKSDLVAAAAGMLNDWKTDSLRIAGLGEGPRRPRRGRWGTSTECGEGEGRDS